MIKVDYSHLLPNDFHAYLTFDRDAYESSTDSLRMAQSEIIGIDPTRLVYSKQIHSKEVLFVDTPGYYSGVDGFITQSRNLCLSIQTADCVPIFIVDKESKTIGLIHAGWRGVSKNIQTQAIEHMNALLQSKNENLFIIIGPSIRSCCYEVGEDVAIAFDEYVQKSSVNGATVLDLPTVVRDKFLRHGLEAKNIHIDGRCTYCDPLQFFSYRREKEKAGRMFSYLMYKGVA